MLDLTYCARLYQEIFEQAVGVRSDRSKDTLHLFGKMRIFFSFSLFFSCVATVAAIFSKFNLAHL